jgi:thiamine kinase-like enzyme
VSGAAGATPLAAAIDALRPVLGEPESEPERLEGGITNRNYRLRWAGRDCVLRLPGKETALLGIDRATERDATRAARGIAPDVIAFEPRLECLVTSFIVGRPVGAEELRGPLLEQVAAALRSVHSGPPLGYAFSPWQRVARYRATALRRGASLPAGFEEVSAAAARISAALGTRASAPCHNDLLTANFMHDGERVRLLDWEYAGQGDPFFDLANLASNNDFDEACEEHLLQAYLGAPPRADQLAALRLMRVMAAFWEAMWAVVQSAVSELDFDFGAYAAAHLARVRERLADPRFEAWLRDARPVPALPPEGRGGA